MKKTDLFAILAGATSAGADTAELKDALIGAAAAIAVYFARRLIDRLMRPQTPDSVEKDSEENP